MNGLRDIAWVFKDNDVMAIQRNGSVFFVLIKQILNDVNDTTVVMMTSFRE